MAPRPVALQVDCVEEAKAASGGAEVGRARWTANDNKLINRIIDDTFGNVVLWAAHCHRQILFLTGLT